MVLKTTFGQSQRWSLTRYTLGVENEGKNNLNFANNNSTADNFIPSGHVTSMQSRVSVDATP